MKSVILYSKPVWLLFSSIEAKKFFMAIGCLNIFF